MFLSGKKNNPHYALRKKNVIPLFANNQGLGQTTRTRLFAVRRYILQYVLILWAGLGWTVSKGWAGHRSCTSRKHTYTILTP